MIQKIKGTQDFLDIELRNFVIKAIQKQLLIRNFREIELPILEPVELFKRTVGEETDIVSKEMFTIAPHPGSNEQICLRPEGTAQTIRAFLENGIQQLPWKVFSIGSMFRYERPQKGRYRQFSQCNIEVVGTNCIEQDILLIQTLNDLFKQHLEIADHTLQLNFLGCKDDRVKFKALLINFLQENAGICETCQRRSNSNPLRIFDCKSETCQKIYQQAPKLTNSLCSDCASEWNYLREGLEVLEIPFVMNSSLVRGLDYYNKTVFEFTSPSLGAQSAFCGGGRYEIATQLGHKEPVPALGAAIGMERVLLILAANNFKVDEKTKLVAIIPLTALQNLAALTAGRMLSNAEITNELILEGESVKSKMRRANKLNADYVILIGENEVKNQMVTVKEMLSGQEEMVEQIKILQFLNAKIEKS